MQNLEISLVELKNMINNYKLVASDEVNCDFNELCDAANGPHEFILETFKFDTEWDQDLMDYLLKATDLEAANYLLDIFLPKFEKFVQNYGQWINGGDVEKIGEDTYIEQTTQWSKKFTEDELMQFFVREYCFEELKINNK